MRASHKLRDSADIAEGQPADSAEGREFGAAAVIYFCFITSIIPAGRSRLCSSHDVQLMRALAAKSTRTPTNNEIAINNNAGIQSTLSEISGGVKWNCNW